LANGDIESNMKPTNWCIHDCWGYNLELL